LDVSSIGDKASSILAGATSIRDGIFTIQKIVSSITEEVSIILVGTVSKAEAVPCICVVIIGIPHGASRIEDESSGMAVGTIHIPNNLS
jgi:hypothetical protein